MSRQRQMIGKALAEAGYEVIEIEWAPIGIAFEMCGPSGGWYVTTKTDSFCGYNAKEVCQQIQKWKVFQDQDAAQAEPKRETKC